jgi:hypothetical protein
VIAEGLVAGMGIGGGRTTRFFGKDVSCVVVVDQSPCDAEACD